MSKDRFRHPQDVAYHSTCCSARLVFAIPYCCAGLRVTQGRLATTCKHTVGHISRHNVHPTPGLRPGIAKQRSQRELHAQRLQCLGRSRIPAHRPTSSWPAGLHVHIVQSRCFLKVLPDIRLPMFIDGAAQLCEMRGIRHDGMQQLDCLLASAAVAWLWRWGGGLFGNVGWRLEIVVAWCCWQWQWQCHM
jgi:hypothetical protein